MFLSFYVEFLSPPPKRGARPLRVAGLSQGLCDLLTATSPVCNSFNLGSFPPGQGSRLFSSLDGRYWSFNSVSLRSFTLLVPRTFPNKDPFRCPVTILEAVSSRFFPLYNPPPHHVFRIFFFCLPGNFPGVTALLKRKVPSMRSVFFLFQIRTVIWYASFPKASFSSSNGTTPRIKGPLNGRDLLFFERQDVPFLSPFAEEQRRPVPSFRLSFVFFSPSLKSSRVYILLLARVECIPFGLNKDPTDQSYCPVSALRSSSPSNSPPRNLPLCEGVRVLLPDVSPLSNSPRRHLCPRRNPQIPFPPLPP